MYFYVGEDAYDGSTFAVFYVRNNQIIVGNLTSEQAEELAAMLNTITIRECYAAAMDAWLTN